MRGKRGRKLAGIQHGALLLLGMLSLLAVPCGVARGQSLELEHSPVAFAEEGKPLEVSATLEPTGRVGVAEARIWYRQPGEAVYNSTEMQLSGQRFSGLIPGKDVTAAGLEYYIQFVLTDGASLTYPAMSATSNPVQVSVRTRTAPGLDVLLPEKGQVLEPGDLIVFALRPELATPDSASFSLVINGQDVTAYASIRDELIVYSLQPVRGQVIHVQLVARHGEEREILGRWQFPVRPVSSPGKTTGKKRLRGEISSEGRVQQYSGEEMRVFRQGVDLEYRQGEAAIRAHGVLTSEEQGHLQPQHRFTLSAEIPRLRLRAGDMYPRYHDLLLAGRRVRGVELDWRPGLVRTQFLYGQLRRPVDGRRYVDGISGDTTYDYGTYHRTLASARLALEKPGRFVAALTLLKAKDDTSSITYGYHPKDNLAVGGELDLALDRGRITLENDLAISLYNENTREEILDGMSSFEKLIVVNPYFQPLPREIDQEGETVSTGELLSSILDKSFSMRSQLRLRYLRQDLRTGFERINVAFYSLANSWVSRDQASWYIRNRTPLLQNRAYLNLGYEQVWDNLRSEKESRVTNHILHGGFSMFTGERYPDISLQLRRYAAGNDAEAGAEEMAGSELPDARMENASNSLALNLSQLFQALGRENRASLNLMFADRQDTYQPSLENSSGTLLASVQTRWSSRMESSLRFSHSELTGFSGETDMRQERAGLRADASFLNRALRVYAGPSVTLGDGQMAHGIYDPGDWIEEEAFDDPADYQAAVREARSTSRRYQISQYLRAEWRMGTHWQFLPRHRLLLDLSFAMLQDDSEYVYWNGASFPADEETVINDGYSVEQPVTGSEDYFVALTYQYLF